MNKQELVKVLSKRTGFAQHDAKELLDATFVIIGGYLSNQDSINIQNFATFSTKKKKSRRFYNVATKEMMIAPKKIAVQFTASSNLNSRINERLSVE